MSKTFVALVALAVLVVGPALADERLFVVNETPRVMGDILSLDGVNVYAVIRTGLLVGADAEGQRNLRSSGYRIVGIGEQQDNSEYFILRLQDAQIQPGPNDKRITIIYQNGTELIVRFEGWVDHSLLSYADDIIHIPFVAIKQIAVHGLIPAVPDVPDPRIAAIVSEVNRDVYAGHIETLEDFVSRWSEYQSCRAAEQWALNEFASMGLETQMFAYPHQFDFWYDVIGRKVGVLYPDSIYIIIAHIDSRALIQQSIAPGAQDNGSGAALVLEAARVLSLFNFNCTIEFVLVSGEEQGLYGSAAYAQHCVEHERNIAGVFNFDMISYSEEPSGWDLHVKADEHNQAEKNRAEVLRDCLYLYSDVETVCRHYTNGPEQSSDHYWFSVYGYPAPFAIDAEDRHAEDWYPWYHTSFDRIRHLDLDFGTEVVKGAVATLATVAGVRPDEDLLAEEGDIEPVLYNNFPNPFNPATDITYCLAREERVTLRVFNVLGQEVAVLVDAVQSAGMHQVHFDGVGYPSGIYVCQLETPRVTATRKMMLLK